MSQNFLTCDRDQQMLLPADMREWLAEDHLAWFVLDAVEEMDLTPFFSGYRDDGWGRAAHDPEMMVSLLVYAYAVGERSSRRIEKRCSEDIAFRVIAANQAPDHTTIARFRARHADDLAELFSEVLALCAKAGLVSVGTIALDGTRIAAVAADRSNRTYEQLAKEILEEAAEVDAEEDERFGDRRGDELPGDRASRRHKLRDAKRRLDQEHAQQQREMAAWERAKTDYTARTGYAKKGAPTEPRPIPPKEKQRVNVTDPDSKPVKTGTGFIQGYTAQAVATEEQVIVAAEVITGGNERHRLEPPKLRKPSSPRLGSTRSPSSPSPMPATGTARRSTSSRPAGSRFSARPTPTVARHRRRSDRGPTTSGCEDGYENPRPRRPIEDASR